MKRIILSIMAVSAIALTSCKKDEAATTELGSATITGTIRADIDQTNDVNASGMYNEYSMPENVEGMTVKVTVDTRNWVQAPVSGYNYDKKVYTATTDANGEFTLTMPATEEGFNVTITFEDKHGVTRKMITSNGSDLNVESYVSRNDAVVYVYSGAALTKVYDANITAENNGGNEYGTATVYGSVYADMDDGTTDEGYEKLTSTSFFPGKQVILTWDYAPFNTGYETPLSFTIDASGNYKAVVPTEMVGGSSVDFYLGMHDFVGQFTFIKLDGSADSTWQARYSLTNGDILEETYNTISAGQINTGVDLYFDAQPIY